MPDSTCRWPDCDSKAVARGLCRRDYARAKRISDFDAPWMAKDWSARRYSNSGECRWPDCNRQASYAGLCQRDYSRAKRIGNTVNPWDIWDTSGTCSVCGKLWDSGRNLKKGYCSPSCRTFKWRQDNPERSENNRRDSVRRRRARQYATQVDSFTTKDVRALHGDSCYLCGKSINFSLRAPNPKSPSLDHVKPLSLGGTHTLENVAMTHLACNVKKSAHLVGRIPQPTLFAI